MIDSKLLEEAHLRYTTDTIPGFGRKQNEKSVSYTDLNGKVITDSSTIERINSLAIPPAWQDVWISPYTNSHLQATGIDDKGRKQYRYHPRFVALSQENKFQHILIFIAQLPLIRETVRKTLEKPGISKEKVIATVVWLLEKTLIRIGNEEYEKENHSYGLTTLKNKHVTIDGSEITFSFKGKSGIYHEVNVQSRKVARIIRQLQDLPGQELFEYRDEEKNIQTIDSYDVNEYLKQITNAEITAKDFRTWTGTFQAAKLIDTSEMVTTKTEIKKLFSRIVKIVAKILGNLPSTSRKYYIHPGVFDAYYGGYTLSNIHTHEKYKGIKQNKELNEAENKLVCLVTIFSRS